MNAILVLFPYFSYLVLCEQIVSTFCQLIQSSQAINAITTARLVVKAMLDGLPNVYE